MAIINLNYIWKISLVNNQSNLKLNESIEIEKFNRNKLKQMHVDMESRPSDPEHFNPFRPTHFSMNDHNNSYELDNDNKKGKV